MGRKERVSHRLQGKAASVFGCAEGLPMMNLSSPGACFYRCTFCCCFLLCFSHWCRLFVKMDMRDFYGLYGHIVLGVLYTYICIYFFFLVRPQFHDCVPVYLFSPCQGDRWLLLRCWEHVQRCQVLQWYERGVIAFNPPDHSPVWVLEGLYSWGKLSISPF